MTSVDYQILMRFVVPCIVTLAMGPLATLDGGTAFAQAAKSPKPVKTRTAQPALTAPPVISRTESDSGAPPQKIENIYRYLLDATVLIVVNYPEQGLATGTGWVVDKERCLVVTNQHVVETQPTARAVFAKFNGTKLITKIDGYPEAEAIGAVVIDSDPNFDLALLKLDRLPETARELKLTTRDVSPGEKIHTIAGLPDGTDGMWIYGTGTVRQISEGRLANGSLTALMESDIPINQGNSGAAVIDDVGEVVAVAEGYMTQVRGTSLCVAAESVKQYLDMVLPLAEPTTVEHFIAIGRRAYEQGRSETAMQAFTAGLDLDDTIADLHIGRGLLLLDAGDAETAIADFTSALERDPKNIDALRGRAMCQEAMGDPEAALADLTKAIQKNPQDAAIYNERGCLRTRLEDHQKAEADFNRAITLDETEPQYLINRCITRRNLGNIDGALQDIARVCEANPENVDAVNEFGLTLHANEEYDKAAEMFSAAMEYDQTNADYPLNLGDALQSGGQHQSALAAYHKSAQLDRENPYLWYSIGLSQHELSNHDSALEAYQQAIQLDGEYAEAWYAMSQTLKAMGQNAAARKALQKARELDSDFEQGD